MRESKRSEGEPPEVKDEGWRAHRIHPLLAPPKYATRCEVVRRAGLAPLFAADEEGKGGRKFFNRGLIYC